MQDCKFQNLAETDAISNDISDRKSKSKFRSTESEANSKP